MGSGGGATAFDPLILGQSVGSSNAANKGMASSRATSGLDWTLSMCSSVYSIAPVLPPTVTVTGRRVPS